MRKTLFEGGILRYFIQSSSPPQVFLRLSDLLRILNSNLEIKRAIELLNTRVERSTVILIADIAFVGIGGVTYLAIATRSEKSRRFNRWYYSLFLPQVLPDCFLNE